MAGRKRAIRIRRENHASTCRASRVAHHVSRITRPPMLRRYGPPVLALLLAAALLGALGTRLTGLPPLGTLLDPADGLYRTARRAAYPERTRLRIPEALEAPVTVVRDARGVPHIFAQSHADATAALGYVVARDRLFQLDFIPRVASGRLAEAFGPSSVETDRFLRQTGMEGGAKKNLRRILSPAGLPPRPLVAAAEPARASVHDLRPHLPHRRCLLRNVARPAGRRRLPPPLPAPCQRPLFAHRPAGTSATAASASPCWHHQPEARRERSEGGRTSLQQRKPFVKA
ncbi:MAG: hypothetical protein BRD38_01930 [Bacteroidetes bacterium QH_9_67_14]|nr:MAG: hypothetical protein BRD38_01930 [Bacteroidetes bacterium QH_9_67_14]